MKDDEEVGVEELRKNQKLINGAVIMLLKVSRYGKVCKNESRWREIMLSNSLESCPLWLLYKEQGSPTPHTLINGAKQWDEHTSH